MEFVPQPLDLNGLPGKKPGRPGTDVGSSAAKLVYTMMLKLHRKGADQRMQSMMKPVWERTRAERLAQGTFAGMLVQVRVSARPIDGGAALYDPLGVSELCAAPTAAEARTRWQWLNSQVQRRYVPQQCYPGQWQAVALSRMKGPSLRARPTTPGASVVTVPYYLRHRFGQ